LDKIIKSGADTGKNPPRMYHFSPIDKAAPQGNVILGESTCQHFQSGLIQTQVQCPPLSEMEKRLSKGSPSDHRMADGTIRQDPESLNTIKGRYAATCIWGQFQAAMCKHEEEKESLFEKAAKETAKLSLAISNQVMNADPGLDPGMVLSIADKALQNIKKDHPIHLRIHPRDLNTLKQADLDTTCLEKASNNYVFHEDETLDRGACQVEKRKLDIDTCIRKQFTLMERDFASRCAAPQSGSGGAPSSLPNAAGRSRLPKIHKGMP